ncbi:C-type lectin domain family 4 member E-like isoform X1 [Biomphalaria pfeifferi]|uniref:C-type lectin domain family 4 member E-like isoform X1 n=1 Tax=Biomphalaria pfeifferi TaxID=112525 RepID=A0AAD8EXW8_BIOPF|nr:C-type lectin domain family 4 member E-like isoform X1 [Biomphalaria pfeifferi]
MNRLWFDVLLFLLAGCKSLTLMSFKSMTNSSYGSAQIGDPWSAVTLTSCIVNCRIRFNNCFSVVYNGIHSLCTPGGKITYNVSRGSYQVGDKLYYTDHCNATQGYKLYVYKSVVNCFHLATNWAVYPEAKSNCSVECVSYFMNNKKKCLILGDFVININICCAVLNDVDLRAIGGRIMQGKTRDSLDLFLSFCKNVYKTYTFLGLTDIVTEGTFVWEDGTVLDPTWKNIVFYSGEPNGGSVNPNDDCAVCGSYSGFSSVFDAGCFRVPPEEHYYICELVE